MKMLQWKEFFRCISKTKSRFISMLLIASLGVAFYVGIRASGPDMELSADALYDQTNLMDIRVLGTLGMTEDDVNAIRAIEGVTEAQGAYSADAICTVNGIEYVAAAFSLCDSINQMTVEQGRLPEAPSECFVDTLFLASTGLELGDTITLSSGTDDALADTFKYDTFTIVGSGTYSWYLNWKRGTTGLADGNVDFFLGLPPDAFSLDVYTVVYASVDSADSLNSYSDAYSDAISEVTDRIEAIAGQRCEIRYQAVTADAQVQINDAQKEIDDAQKEIDDGKSELDDALAKLEDAELEIADAEQQLADSQAEIDDAEQEITDGERELGAGRKALILAQIELKEQTSVFYDKTTELEAGQSELDSQKSVLLSKQTEVDTQKATLEQHQMQITQQQAELDQQRSSLESQKSELTSQRAQLLAQQAELLPSLNDLRAQKESLTAQRTSISQGISLYEQRSSLQAQRSSLSDQLSQTESGLADVANLRAPLDAQMEALLPTQTALSQRHEELDARQTALDQEKASISVEQDSVQAARSALDSLTPSSWTTVDGYQAMLNRLDSLSDDYAGQTERSVLESVHSAVQGALSEGETISDALLSSVVPNAAASAIDAAVAAVSSKESSIAQLQAGLSEKQNDLNRDYESYQAEKASFDAAYNPLSESIAALESTQQELTSAQAALIDGIAQIDAGLVQINAAINSIGMSHDELTAAKSSVEDGLAQIDANLPALESAAEQLESALSQIDGGLAQINEGLSQIDGYQAELTAGQQQITDGFAQIEAGQSQLDEAWSQIDEAQNLLDDGRSQLADGGAQLADAQQIIYDKQLELAEGEAALADARRQLREGIAKLNDGRQELSDARQELKEGRTEYEQGLLDYEEAVAEAQPELDDARRQLSDARAELETVEAPEWYVLDRNSIQTFVEYGMDAERISAIGTVFPVIFFLVAALVCLTGMTRMVEEERIQIGTFKALGYGKAAIAAKYFLYAFIASVVGSVIGIFVGSSLLPQVIMSAYGILYSTLTDLLTPIHWPLSLSAVGLAVFCTVFAAMSACLRTLRETPASLMRPTSPPKGKRVFLEYIRPLWKRLSFGQKAAARNLFRYKKRLFMTIIGIAGCMALLVVGFGLRDSINKIVDTQYTAVWTYDASVNADADDLESLREYIQQNEPTVTGLLAVQQNAMDTEANGRSAEAYLFVPETTDGLDAFVRLHDRLTHHPYELDDSGVIISEKLSTLLGLSVGDTITLCKSETERYDARVQAIAENYLNHYVYMTPAFYQQLFAEAPEFSQLFMKMEAMSENESLAFSERMLSLESIKSISLVSDLQDSVDEMMNAMNLVIWVLIIAAGMLAFIVLFNLNNISILERRRELATLRVLGFYDGELAAYLYRENVVLTVLGIAAGVGLGVVLHRFVITTCEIDMIMFGRAIQPLSYAASVLMTIFFAALVNLGMFFTLRKIDMVESLKSVE